MNLHTRGNYMCAIGRCLYWLWNVPLCAKLSPGFANYGKREVVILAKLFSLGNPKEHQHIAEREKFKYDLASWKPTIRTSTEWCSTRPVKLRISQSIPTRKAAVRLIITRTILLILQVTSTSINTQSTTGDFNTKAKKKKGMRSHKRNITVNQSWRITQNGWNQTEVLFSQRTKRCQSQPYTVFIRL